MKQHNVKDLSRLRLILLCSLVIILAAQINVSLYPNNFKISTAVILFPIFLFFWEKFPIMWVTIVSGIGVFLSRCVVHMLNEGLGANLSINFLPEAFFYFAYGTLFFLYCQKVTSDFSNYRDFFAFACIDYIANLTELILRVGVGTFDMPAQTSIILAALFRSCAALLILSVIKRSHLLMLKREHAERYRNLLLLISKLNGEVLWMKKNTTLMEQTMNTCYQLYSDLSQQNVPEELTHRALQTARDIHEIKKEYFIILRGISDALDLNLKDEGMYVKDLLKLLSDTFTSSVKSANVRIELSTNCSPDLFTDRHYFLLSIFNNLFSNALEACSSLSEIKIICTQYSTDSSYCFTVKDNGRGIAKEDLASIFLPGYSTKINYQTGEVSRGLGLNLVQDLVENQFHGKISVSSKPGNTTFTISIPKSELKVVTS